MTGPPTGPRPVPRHRRWGGGRTVSAAARLGAEGRHYLLLVRVAFRVSAEYRGSLALRTLAEIGATVLDLLAIGIIFTHLPRLDGFDRTEVAFLYGTSALAFALAEALLGQTDRLGWIIRDGKMDVLLIRPMSVLVQAAAADFAPQRIGRVLQPAVIVVVASASLDVHWTAGRIAGVPLMILSGTLIAASLRVAAASVLFVAPDASVAVTAIAQGSGLATQYPMTIYGRHLALLLTVVLPIGFVNWQPALHVLGRPDPLGLPAFTRYASPAVAVLVTFLAGLCWRSGVRHYRSTGS